LAKKPMKGELGTAEPFRGVVAEGEGDVVGRPGKRRESKNMAGRADGH
jgi:hypothetical protein